MSFIPKNYKTVDSEELVRELLEYIDQHDIHAYDVEANGLNPRTSKIIGFSVSAKPGDGYYLPTKKYNPETDSLEKLYIKGVESDKVAKVVIGSLVGKKLCMHNGVYDCEITKQYYGISLIGSLWVENLLLVHTVAEEGAKGMNKPFALKTIAQWKQEDFKLDAERDANEEQIALKESIKKNGGSISQNNMEMYKADLDVICTYGASDADLTIRSVEHFLPILKEEGLWDFFFGEEVMPVYRNLTYVMETRGVKLNIELLRRLREEIVVDIQKYHDKVLESLMKSEKTQLWVVSTALDKYSYKVFDEKKGEYKIKNRGKNAQAAVQMYFDLMNLECPLPTNPKKPDQWHITKGNLEKYLEDELHKPLRDFLLDGIMDSLSELDSTFFTKCSMMLWKEENDGYYIKLSSKKQLAEIVFDHMGEKPLSHTAKGSPQFNDTFVESIKEKYKWSQDLYIFNRLNKIKSSYFDKLWEGREEDRYYFNFKQHGTVSGRYGSDAQQMPRPMEPGEDPDIVIKYSNEVRALMIPDDGWVFVDADYESLEPFTFAAVTGDEGLKDIFRKGHDFYSTIAIATEKLEGVSPDKKADNYLKKVNPVKRQTAKAYCLDGDTKVITNESTYSVKCLKDIKVGDFVLSKNNYNRVLNTFKRVAATCLVKTTLIDIRCTIDHKFYIDGEWVEAQHLQTGTLVHTFVRFESPVCFIEDVIFDNKVIDVYDITVENEHNFYANGILVHNCLGIPYGMSSFALHKTIDVPKKEAEELVEGYLNAYPELRKWMEYSNEFAKKNGYIKNKVGRVRHLQQLKVICDAFWENADKLLDYKFRAELEKKFSKDKVLNIYRDFKNSLNNAKNWQIQSLAASIVNRAGLGVVRESKKLNIEVYPVAQIHDQWIFTVRKGTEEQSSKMIQHVMETETDIGMDLKAPPEIAENWRDGH